MLQMENMILWARVGSEGGERWLNSGCMIKVGQIEFAGRSDLECEREKVNDNCKILS